MEQQACSAHRVMAEVGPDGRVEVRVPVPAGTRVEVLVIAPADDPSTDLLQAAGSSLDFWNNPLDDEDWNDAGPR
jgi:hypothetical protein